MAFIKSPSTTQPNVALGSRRATGDASPLWAFGDEACKPSRKNIGSLYLFGVDGPETPPQPTPRTISRRNGNCESHSQQEWPRSGIRRVDPCVHNSRNGGVRIVTATRNHEQHVAVVGGQTAWADATPRGIRCGGYTQDRNHVATVEKLLDRDLELGSDADVLFIEKLNEKILPDHSVSSVEKFAMAVADHVQHRSSGSSSFFVALSRGLVAPNATSAPTTSLPPPRPDLWSEPPKRRLTLAKCHSQLVGLTGILDVSVRDLAAVFWDMDGMDNVPDETVNELEVSFADFAGAFAVAPKSKKLSSYKI